MMIDWLTIVVPIRHDKMINGGYVRSFGKSSEGYFVEWEAARRMQMRGSFDNSVTVRTLDLFADGSPWQSIKESALRYLNLLDLDYLFNIFKDEIWLPGMEQDYRLVEISGNPAKYFQGHNLFGSDDVYALARDMANEVCKSFGLHPTPADLQRWQHGMIYVRRIDLANMYKLYDDDEVLSWINSMKHCASMSGKQGDKKQNQNTFYFNQGSSHAQLKYYAKGLEVRKHPPNFEGQLLHDVVSCGHGYLREELQLNSRWFRRQGISTLFNLWEKHPCLGAIMQNYQNKITVGRKNFDTSHIHFLKSNMRPALRSTFMLWLEAPDKKSLQLLIPHNTFYSHKKELLKDHGINISVPYSDALVIQKPKVIPLLRVVEAVPVEAPGWFHRRGLIYEPDEHLLKVVK